MIQKQARIYDTFIESSLLITKEEFYSLHKKFECANPLSIDRTPLTYTSYRQRFLAVGSPWSWDKRPKYKDTNAVKKRINDPRSRLYVFSMNETEIGFGLSVSRDDLSIQFNKQIGEIENFGLSVPYNGKHYGKHFFRAMCHELFTQGHEGIFLSTRSTNHENVLPFYQKMGMRLIKQVTLKNDLV